MKIRKVDTERKQDVAQFIHFPFELYRDCTLWVPPLVSSDRDILNRRKHPFYEHSTADFFVAVSNGHTLGRIAVLENKNHNAFHGTKTAFFGYFEVVEDYEVAYALLGTAMEWAKARGLNEMIGPRGVIGIDGSVLVEGFEHRPAMGIPYNYPYYNAFIKEAGFEKDADYLSGYLRGNHQLSERIHRIAEKVKKRRGFWIKTFRSKREARSWVPRIIKVHREAFSSLHSYYPPTDAEIKMVVNTLLMIADPHLLKLVMKEQEIVGFIFAYHDISAALQKANGRLWPFGWYHLLRERRRTTWANINGLGLLPAYQGLGANTVLYTELQKTIHAFNFEHIDVVQVDENNLKSYADMENIGVSWYKRHRHYRRTL